MGSTAAGPMSFNTVSFVDADEGWAGGAYDWSNQSALMHTTDGGATWTFVPTGDAVWTYDIAKVQFVDADHGWILQSYAGQMARTTDGGATWQALDTAGMIGTSDFTFLDAQHGWLVGQASQGADGTPIGKTAYTTDGGVTWTPDGVAYSGGYTTATRVAFGDAQHGYAVGQGGWVQRTTDGGVTWQQVDLAAQTPPLPFRVTTADYKDVVATDAMHAAAVAGNGVILRTADGGATWFEQDSGRERSAPVRAPVQAAAPGRHRRIRRRPPLGGRIPRCDPRQLAFRRGRRRDSADDAPSRCRRGLARRRHRAPRRQRWRVRRRGDPLQGGR